MRIVGPDQEFPAPAYCSACFSAKPQMRHIDFECVWDGPVINVEDGIRVQVDDLIVCEDCLSAAAARLDIANAGAARISELENRVFELDARRAHAEAALAKVREAMPTTPSAAGEAAPKRRGRPPKVAA